MRGRLSGPCARAKGSADTGQSQKQEKRGERSGLGSERRGQLHGLRFRGNTESSQKQEKWSPLMSSPKSSPNVIEHLVLIPGLLCTEALFAAQSGGLAPVATISVGDHASHDTMSALASGILAAAPPRFALAGLSMGGYVALEIMRQAPERVSRLALLDTSARPDLPEQTENRRRLVALADRKGVETPAREMFPKLVAPARAGDEGLSAIVLDMARAIGAEGFARQQAAIATRIDSRPALAAIACPTLVLVGSDDQLTPPAVAEEMARGIPGARLEVIAGSGHLSPLEAPDAVTAALSRWLAS